MKVGGVLGGDEGDLKEMTLLYRFVRYGQTMQGWLFLEWEADPRHVDSFTETLGLRRAEATKTQSSPGVMRGMHEVKHARDWSDDLQERTEVFA